MSESSESEISGKRKIVPFPEMVKWLNQGGSVHDFPADSERDLPWPEELKSEMEKRSTLEKDVDQEFWEEHTTN